MPQAIYHAGYVLGTFGVVVIGLIAVYCMQMLLASHYELCKRKKVRFDKKISVVMKRKK